MPLITLPAGADILGAMITPAVLISASGTLTLATANRLGRVVDRIRKLSEVAEALTAEPATLHAEEKRTLIAASLIVLTRRLRLLQNAITLFYTSIGIYVATSITLGLTFTLKWDNGAVPAMIGLSGALAMFAAVMILVFETRLSVQSTLVEVEYTRRLVERATSVTEVTKAPPPLD